MEAGPLEPSEMVRSMNGESIMVGECSKETAGAANDNFELSGNLEESGSGFVPLAAAEGASTLEEDPFSAMTDDLLGLILLKCDPEAFLAAWQEAAPVFNAKPRQGIAFLMKTGVFETPDAVARFLLTGKNLNRQLIGQYLGDRTRRCHQVLTAYLYQFDFTGLPIENALWAFLAGFGLTKLAHQTRRVIAGFGARYVECNRGCEYGTGVEISPWTAEDLAMCVLELRAVHPVPVRSPGSSVYPLKESRERFLKWAYVKLPKPVLEQIHDRVMMKLSFERERSAGAQG